MSIKYLSRNLSDLINDLRSKYLCQENFLFIVQREHVLSDALRRACKPTFKVEKQVKV